MESLGKWQKFAEMWSCGSCGIAYNVASKLFVQLQPCGTVGHCLRCANGVGNLAKQCTQHMLLEFPGCGSTVLVILVALMHTLT